MNATQTKTRSTVAVTTVSHAVYPRETPYHPSEDYPEYPFGGRLASEPNEVYAGVRRLFELLDLDSANIATERWNPLGRLIEPGMDVVIKPNFVLSRHCEGKDLYAIITHPSVLRAVVDYCWIALKGSGRITIADAPQYNCNFDELLQATGLDSLCGFYADFPGPQVRFSDLRTYWSAGRHFPSCKQTLPGDSLGSVTVNLGDRSALCDCPNPERFYGAVYHRRELIDRHRLAKHEYELSRTIMDADVVISVPKMKVHKKVGVTLNLKGLVGLCTNKNLCLHYRIGSPGEGGDQYPDGWFTPSEHALIRLERWMYDHLLARQSTLLEYIHRSMYWLHGKFIKPFGLTVPPAKRMLDAGNWYGNDSAWRMVCDLLKIFYFADSQGRIHRDPQRRVFSIIDGIKGGQDNGPLCPDPHPARTLIAGGNIVAVDLIAARLMGFDPLRLRLYQNVLNDPDFDYGIHCPDDIEVCDGDGQFGGCLDDDCNTFLNFKPHPGWVGHVEASK